MDQTFQHWNEKRTIGAERIEVQIDATKPFPKLSQYSLSLEAKEGLRPINGHLLSKGLTIVSSSPYKCTSWSFSTSKSSESKHTYRLADMLLEYYMASGCFHSKVGSHF